MKRFSIQQLVLILSLLLTFNAYGQTLSEKQLLEKTLYVTKNVALKNTSEVYRLRLYDYTNMDYAILQKFPNLMVLSFCENSKVDVIPLGFKKLLNLTYLDISETQIKMVSAFTKKNKNLKVVYAKSGQLDNLEKKALTKRGIKVIDNSSEYPLVFLKLEEKIDTNIPIENTPIIINTNYEKYPKNPLASPLLNEKELENKKVYTSLIEALKEPGNVYRINIKKREEGMDITNLSTRIGELYNLQELELFGIYKSLPKEIGKLTQLQKVTLSVPYLEKDLPLEIANWTNIKSFRLMMYSETETNKIIEFNSICMLNSLEELVFHGQNFQKVPEKISNLTQLKKLTIEFSPIKSITPAIGQLTSLTHLNLSGLKNLTSIPAISSSVVKADFRNLDALVSLDQTFTKATNLDNLKLNSLLSLQNFNQSLSNLKSLSILWLSDIPLVTKLFEFDNLDNLNSIYIYGLKNLNQINSEFDNADGLEIIDITDCPSLTINSKLESLVLLRTIKLDRVKTPKLDLNGFEISQPDTKNPNLYSYYRATNLENAFNKNEIIYYNFIKKYKQMADLSFVLKTKNKSLLTGVYLTQRSNQQELDLFLSNIDSYPNLDSLSVSFGPNFNYTPISIAKKLKKIDFEALLDSDKISNWQKANDFINCFLSVEEYEFSGLSKSFYEGNFTSLTNVKKIRIEGITQIGIISDMSKMLLNCKNLEYIKLSEVSDYFPSELFNITSLKIIDVSIWEPKNNLNIVIPDKIINLTNLEKLKIYINDEPTPTKHSISSNINKLQNLEVLYLNFGGSNKNSQKIIFPNGIENLKKLRNLTLVPCNGTPVGLEKLNLTSEFKCSYN